MFVVWQRFRLKMLCQWLVENQHLYRHCVHSTKYIKSLQLTLAKLDAEVCRFRDTTATVSAKHSPQIRSQTIPPYWIDSHKTSRTCQWVNLFCRGENDFAVGENDFAVAKMILPWVNWFCRGENDFAVTVMGHRKHTAKNHTIHLRNIWILITLMLQKLRN